MRRPPPKPFLPPTTADPMYPPATEPIESAEPHSTDWVNTYQLQRPTETELELILHQFLKEYYANCEAYDRTVCTGPIIGDSILPNTPHERMLITQNSWLLWREFLKRADEIGATPGQISKAKSNYKCGG